MYIYIHVIYKIIYIFMGSEIWDMIGTYRLTWGYSVFFCLSEKKGLPNPWRIIIFPIAMLFFGRPIFRHTHV
jgi:hypothetical protein